MSVHPVRDEILALLQPSEKALWHGGPTTRQALADVSAKMACWDPGRGRHTIWGLALHMAFWKYAVRRQVQGLTREGFPRSPDNFPAPPETASEAAWSRDLHLLEQEESALVKLVTTLEEEQLQATSPAGYRVADRLFGIAMHDAHHVGQILLIKRLWTDSQTDNGA